MMAQNFHNHLQHVCRKQMSPPSLEEPESQAVRKKRSLLSAHQSRRGIEGVLGNTPSRFPSVPGGGRVIKYYSANQSSKDYLQQLHQVFQ